MLNNNPITKTQPSYHSLYQHPLNKYQKITIRNKGEQKLMVLSKGSTKQHLKSLLAKQLGHNDGNFYLSKTDKKRLKRNEKQHFYGGESSLYESNMKVTSKKQQLRQRLYSQPKSLATTVTMLQNRRNAQGIIFSKEKRSFQICKEKLEVPGPGRYQTQQSQDANRTSFKFTRSQKFRQSSMFYGQQEKMPGPGQYKVHHGQSLKKGIVFTKAERSQEADKSPGPADYKTQQSLLKQNGGVVSRAKRLSDYKSDGPGPAGYKQVAINLIKTRLRTVIIGQSVSSNDKSQSPGPSSYKKEKAYENEKIVGGVFFRSPKNSNNKGQDLPSSLSYNPSFKHIQKKISSAIIGKEPRFSSINMHFPEEMSKHNENPRIIDKNIQLLNDLKKMNETIKPYSKVLDKRQRANLSSLSVNK